MKLNILGMILALLVLSAGVYAADVQTRVVLTKNDTTGKLGAYVMAFDFNDPTADPAVQKQVVTQINSQCGGLSGTQYADCAYKIQAQYSIAGKVSIYTIKDAKIGFTYWDPINSKYAPLQGCEAVPTSVLKQEKFTSSAGLTDVDVYYAECDFTSKVPTKSKTNLNAVFLGGTYTDKNGQQQNFLESSDSMDYVPQSETNVNFKDILTIIGNGFANAAGLPCVGAFAVLGLMLATMYARGSPMSLLNVQTPKLPTPKGFAASGQVVVAEQGASKVAGAAGKNLLALGKVGESATDVLAAGFNYKQRAQLDQAKPNINTAFTPTGRVAAWVSTPVEAQMRTAVVSLVIANGGTVGKEFYGKALTPEAQAKINAALGAAEKSGDAAKLAIVQAYRTYVAGAAFNTNFGLNSFDKGQTIWGKVVKKVLATNPKVADAGSSFHRTLRMVSAGVKAVPAATKAAALATAKAAAPKTTSLLMAGLARRQKEVEEGKPKKTEETWTKAKQLAAVEGGAKLISNDFQRAQFHLDQELKAAEMASLGYAAMEILGKAGKLKIAMTEEEARGKVNTLGYDVLAVAGLHLNEKGQIEDAHLRALEGRVVGILGGKGDAAEKYAALLAIAREEKIELSPRAKANIDVADAVRLGSDSAVSKLATLENHFATQARESKEEIKQGKATFVNYADHESLKSLDHSGMWTARVSTLLVANLVEAEGKTDDKSALGRALRLARIEMVGKEMGLATDMTKPFGARYSAELAEKNKKELVACMGTENQRAFKAIFGVEPSKAKLEDVLHYVTTGAIREQSVSKTGNDVTKGSEFVANAPNMGGFKFGRWDLHIGEEGTVHATVEERLGRSMTNPLSESIAAQLARMGIDPHTDPIKYRDMAHKLMLKEEENQVLVKTLQPYAHGAYGEDGRNIYFAHVNGMTGILTATLMEHCNLNTLTMLDEEGMRRRIRESPRLAEAMADLQQLVRMANGKLDYDKLAHECDRLQAKYGKLVTAYLAKPVTESDMEKLGLGYSTNGGELTPLIGNGLRVNPREAMAAGLAVIAVPGSNGQLQLREVGYQHADFKGRVDLQVEYQKLAGSSSAKDPDLESKWSTFLNRVADTKDKMRDSDPEKITMIKTYIACLQARDSALGHKPDGWDRANLHVVDPKINNIFYNMPEIFSALGAGEGSAKVFNTVYGVANAWAHSVSTVMQKMGGADFIAAGASPMYWTHYANTYGQMAAFRYGNQTALSDPKYAALNQAWNNYDKAYALLHAPAVHNMDRGAKNSARFSDVYREAGATIGNWTSSQAENWFARSFSRAANWFAAPIAKAASASQFLAQGETGIFDRELRKDSVSYLYAPPSYTESIRAFFGFGTSQYAELHGYGKERAKGYAVWDDKSYVAKAPGGKSASDIHNPGASYVDAHGRLYVESSAAAMMRLRLNTPDVTEAYNRTVYSPDTNIGAYTIHTAKQREQWILQNPQLGFMGAMLKPLQWGMHLAVRAKNGGRPIGETISSEISNMASSIAGAVQTNMDKKVCTSCHKMHKYGEVCNVSGRLTLWSNAINAPYAPQKINSIGSGPSPIDNMQNDLAAMRAKKEARKPRKLNRDGDQAAA